MKIIINIYPDKDGVHCGKCKFTTWRIDCLLFTNIPERETTDLKFIKRRLPECLKAEAEVKEKEVDAVFAHRRKAKSLLGVPPRIPKESK